MATIIRHTAPSHSSFTDSRRRKPICSGTPRDAGGLVSLWSNVLHLSYKTYFSYYVQDQREARQNIFLSHFPRKPLATLVAPYAWYSSSHPGSSEPIRPVRRDGGGRRAGLGAAVWAASRPPGFSAGEPGALRAAALTSYFTSLLRPLITPYLQRALEISLCEGQPSGNHLIPVYNFNTKYYLMLLSSISTRIY